MNVFFDFSIITKEINASWIIVLNSYYIFFSNTEQLLRCFELNELKKEGVTYYYSNHGVSNHK